MTASKELVRDVPKRRAPNRKPSLPATKAVGEDAVNLRSGGPLSCSHLPDLNLFY